MVVNSKKMNGVPVRTVSGQPVGRLASIDFDADTGRMTSVQVRLRGLGLETAQIAWSQVSVIHETEIVVADTSIPAGSSVAVHRTA